MKTLQDYQKTKEYLVCVDSDGCAMDTMDIKHFRAFGPCMVEEWQLGEWEEDILARWNEINLYTMTRGINRFRGLALMLLEVSKKYKPIEGVFDLLSWTENSSELSNRALEDVIRMYPDHPAFRKALNWSIEVNRTITELPEEDIKPFPLAKEALIAAHEVADVAIVSSANLDAVMAEWENHGLLEHTDIVMAQNSGSKTICIASLLRKGYKPENVIMCGDAPGDKISAEKNGVNFFPILVRHERESWQEFIDTALGRLTDGSYSGKYQNEKNSEFLKNLGN